MNPYSHLFFSVVLHIFLLFTFLSIFFWTVIADLESNTLYNEIYNGLNDLLKDIHISKDIYTDDVYNYLKAFFSGENIALNKNNNLLFQFNATIIVLLLFIVLATYFVRHFICGQELNVTSIIIENIIVLIFVGLIEYYFFNHFASKYVPVMPSYLPTLLTEELKKQLI